MVGTPDCRITEKHGDFSYTLERGADGIVHLFRQMLNGDKPDPHAIKEQIRRHNLPSDSLRCRYDVMMQDGVPAK
jgi:hypothetical protein